jgi:RimJ/RimL family protein N-acetyltransferase
MFVRTERLLLRPSWPEDAKALYEAVAQEAIIRNLATVPWPYSPADARNFIEAVHPAHYPQFLLWKRTDAAPRLIGACGLGQRNGDAELGYWIARAHWGQGYASEAARAVINVAKALGHRSLIAGHFTDNPASGRVLEKIGFRKTGQVELRESKGRGTAASSTLYHIDLFADDKNNDDGDTAVGKTRTQHQIAA